MKGMRSMKKTVCELFAGVGGFRVGLEKADSSSNKKESIASAFLSKYVSGRRSP